MAEKSAARTRRRFSLSISPKKKTTFTFIEPEQFAAIPEKNESAEQQSQVQTQLQVKPAVEEG